MRKAQIAVVVFAVAIFFAPPVAHAQQAGKIPRIGVLFAPTPAAAARSLEAFRQGLREYGYVEGKNFVLEPRYGEARATISRACA